jgi:hypothetical protein
LGVVATGVIHLTYRNIAAEGATDTATVGYLLPVVSVALGIIVLDEDFGLRIAMGMGVVLVGVGLARRHTQPSAPAKAPPRFRRDKNRTYDRDRTDSNHYPRRIAARRQRRDRIAKGPDRPVPAAGAVAMIEAFDGTLPGHFGALEATESKGEAVRLPAPVGTKAGGSRSRPRRRRRRPSSEKKHVPGVPSSASAREQVERRRRFALVEHVGASSVSMWPEIIGY